MLVAPTVAPLLRVALFAGLQPIQITELIRNAERITFRDGDTIVSDGETGNAAYVIVRGRAVRRPSGNWQAELPQAEPAHPELGQPETARAELPQAELPQAELPQAETEFIEPGSLIGEMAMLIGDSDYRATIIACGPVRAIKISRAALYAQMATDPELADHLERKVAQRLRCLVNQIRQIDDKLAAASAWAASA